MNDFVEKYVQVV